MEGMEVRGSATLSEQMAAAESSFKLRELLKIRDEDDVRRSGPVSACEKRGGGGSSGAGGGGRRLLDIMREQEANEDAVVGNFGNGSNWKSFADRLRLRRAGDACAAAAISSGQPNRVRNPEIIVSVRPNSASRSISGRGSEHTAPQSIGTQYSHAATDANAAVAPSSLREGHPSGGVGSEARTGAQASSDVGPTAEAPASSTATAAEEGQQARVSLMALLEQTDRQWTNVGDGISLAALAALNALEQAAEDDVDGGGGSSSSSSHILRICCVCMVREKGAAFIPCGHTFCRRCSREVWVNRGSCPLCNGFILEILDIF